MRRTVSVCLFLLMVAAMAAAQSQALPDSPSQARRLDTVEKPSGAVTPVVEVPRQRRTTDAAYWSMMGLSAAAMVADVETTVRAVRNPRCREANPLLGERPKRGTMYALKGGAGAVVALFSYVTKKRGWSKWWLIPVLTSGAHGGVAVSNWRTGCF